MGRRCELCGKAVDESEMLRFGEVWVCANCKPAYVQRLHEGAPPTRPAFRDLAGLTRWVRGLLIADLVFLGLATVMGSIDLMLRLGSDGEITKAIEWNEAGLLFLGGIHGVPSMALVVLFLRWTYLANANARALGAQGMRFSPGWSIGWHFIPIANFTMPYRAMKEIWQASAAPHEWQGVKVPAILPWWWALWIISILLSIVTTTVVFRVPAGSVAESVSFLVCYPFDIPLTLLLMKIVREIWKAQARNYGVGERS